jgi:hypothetical protein
MTSRAFESTRRILARSLRPKELAVLLHDGLHAGNLLVASHRLNGEENPPSQGEENVKIKQNKQKLFC